MVLVVTFRYKLREDSFGIDVGAGDKFLGLLLRSYTLLLICDRTSSAGTCFYVTRFVLFF
jgi:hypothetical protein